MIDVDRGPQCSIELETLFRIAGALRRAATVIEDEESVSFGEVSVLVVNTAHIQNLHAVYFDDPSPTDVITFPGARDEGDRKLSGDIAICHEVAALQAEDAGQSLEEEILFLAVHGLLHLSGWDDGHPEARAAMLNRQSDVIARAISTCSRHPIRS